MSIRVTGVSNVLGAMKKMKAGDAVNIAEGLKKAAEMVLKAAGPMVPVATGALRKSGRVVTRGVGMAARATVEYGGEGAHYALWVHENLQARHAPPTTARWLPKAVNKVKGSIVAMMKRQVSSGVAKAIDGKEVS